MMNSRQLFSRISLTSTLRCSGILQGLLLLCFIFIKQVAIAQSDSTASKTQISAYLEPYFSYAGVQQDHHAHPDFIYSHNRHNEFNINIALLKLAYETKQLRAAVALMAGTYVNANLKEEPGVLKNIFEANMGIRLSKKHDWWLDAGVFASHIGFESTIGKDCWTLTRSIQADNTPYYETGIKSGFTSSDGKWFLSALWLNGWQRIQRQDANHTPAFGHQIIYKPSKKASFNSSSFIGSNTPDSIRRMRYFHNLYGILQCTQKFGLTLGVDLGFEQKFKRSLQYHHWLSAILIGRYQATPKHTFALRTEYYHDPSQVIITSGTPHGFRTFASSFNFDYQVQTNALWRIEAKWYQSRDAIFSDNKLSRQQSLMLTSCLAVSF